MSNASFRAVPTRLLLLSLLLALVIAGCGLGQSGSSSTRGVVYTDGERIWVIDPDTPNTAPREVISVRGNGTVTDPVWSPDGSRIAYSYTPAFKAGASFGSDIYVVGANGRDPQALFTHDVEGGLARAPAWSPDGAFLYFAYSYTTKRPGQSRAETLQQIVRLEVATGTRAVVAENADLPALSPDGTRLAFLRYAADITQPPVLWIAQADGSEARPLVPEGIFQAVWAPRFAPDGQHLLFMAHGGDRSRPRLNVQPPRPTGLAWPPTVAAHGLPMDLWLVDMATGQRELLAALGADDPHAAWGPDGKRLAYLSAEGSLFTLDLTTGALTLLPRATGGFGSLDWSR